MKSSIRTRSRPEISLGPRAALPFVILTRLTSGNPKSTPRNEKVWSPNAEGTKNVPRSWLLAPKNVNDVVFGRSTSVKMAPKPLGRVLINRECCGGVRAIFFRRRHQPRRPPLARIRPGRPAPLKQSALATALPARSVVDQTYGVRRFAADGAAPRREERRKPLQDPAIPHPQSAPALPKLRSAVHPRSRLEPRRQSEFDPAAHPNGTGPFPPLSRPGSCRY
jgi:hypothetical protein